MPRWILPRVTRSVVCRNTADPFRFRYANLRRFQRCLSWCDHSAECNNHRNRLALRAEGPFFKPSRERKRATRSGWCIGARNTRFTSRDACLLRSGHSEPRTGVSDPLSSTPAGQKHKVDHIGAWFLLHWGHEPGVAGPEATFWVGRSLTLAARFRTFTPGPRTWCCRSKSVLLSGSLAHARGSVRRRRFAVVNSAGHGWLSEESSMAPSKRRLGSDVNSYLWYYDQGFTMAMMGSPLRGFRKN